MSTQHFITKCSCGNVIAQCRCSDKNKTVNIVKRGCEQCHAIDVSVLFVAPNHIEIYAKQDGQSGQQCMVLNDAQAKIAMSEIHSFFHGED